MPPKWMQARETHSDKKRGTPEEWAFLEEPAEKVCWNIFPKKLFMRVLKTVVAVSVKGCPHRSTSQFHRSNSQQYYRFFTKAPDFIAVPPRDFHRFITLKTTSKTSKTTSTVNPCKSSIRQLEARGKDTPAMESDVRSVTKDDGGVNPF